MNKTKTSAATSRTRRTLTPQKKYEYSENRLLEMTHLLMSFDEQITERRKKPREKPLIWNCANLLQCKQALSQVQMRDACDAIRENVRNAKWFSSKTGFCTEINFLDFTQKCGGDTFYLSDAVVCVSGMDENELIGLLFPEYNRINARVIIGNYNGATQGFLEAECINGEYRIAELSGFSMLSTFTVDGENSDIKTVFSKPFGVADFDVIGSMRKNLPPRADIPANAKAPCRRAGYILPDDAIETLLDENKAARVRAELESVIAERDIEIKSLHAKLNKADEQAGRQREENKRLADELSRENKEAAKPLAAEGSRLNGKIRALERSLEAEQAKNPELHALREFVFASQSEYVPPEMKVSLAEVIRGKKVFIVGGHVGWRNKMRERYPAITFLDGKSVAFDNSIFGKSDFILFYNSYMSHKVYRKIIDYLRDKRLRFDYLGRSVNKELLEAEITAVLKEKMCS